jgi:hypothetical protein
MNADYDLLATLEMKGSTEGFFTLPVVRRFSCIKQGTFASCVKTKLEAISGAEIKGTFYFWLAGLSSDTLPLNFTFVIENIKTLRQDFYWYREGKALQHDAFLQSRLECDPALFTLLEKTTQEFKEHFAKKRNNNS